MGLKPSVFNAEKTTSLDARFPSLPAFTIGASQFYNFYQASIRRPSLFIFYDLRGKRDFDHDSVRNAFWGWEGNVKSRRSSGSSAASSRNRRSTGKGDKPSQYEELLCQETQNRIVVIFSDARHSHHYVSFLKALENADAKPLLVCYLKTKFDEFSKTPYNFILASSTVINQGPSEIFAPRRYKRSFGPAIFVSGVEVLPDQAAALGRFKIDVVVNVSSTVPQVPLGIAINHFSSKFSSPNLREVAMCLQKHVKAKRAVVIVDDVEGAGYACAACVAYLVLEGLDIEAAIHIVKEKKIFADMNFINAVRSDPPQAKPSAGVKKSFRLGMDSVRIPMKLLDIPEVAPMRAKTDLMASGSFSEASSSSEEESPPPSPEESVPSPPPLPEGMVVVTPPHAPSRAAQKDVVSPSIRARAALFTPPPSPPRVSQSSAPSKKKGRLQEDSFPESPPGDSSEEHGMSPFLATSNFSSPEVTVPVAQYPLAAIEEVPADAEIEYGVLYEAEDGTQYYYEEVLPDE